MIRVDCDDCLCVARAWPFNCSAVSLPPHFSSIPSHSPTTPHQHEEHVIQGWIHAGHIVASSRCMMHTSRKHRCIASHGIGACHAERWRDLTMQERDKVEMNLVLNGIQSVQSNEICYNHYKRFVLRFIPKACVLPECMEPLTHSNSRPCSTTVCTTLNIQGGWIHHKCRMKFLPPSPKSSSVSSPTSRDTSIDGSSSNDACVDGLKPRRRKRKHYHDLSRTEKYKRLQLAYRCLDDIGVPVSALVPPEPSPASFLHLSTAKRNTIRSVDDLSIPSERIMKQLKCSLARTHGTETAVYSNESCTIAYLTDPFTFIQHITQYSSYIAIGGDAGGECTKLGISYSNVQGREEFAPILCMDGKDNFDSLSRLLHPICQFNGQSSRFNNIWTLLQNLYYITTRKQMVLLNGDWNFINAVRGLKSASALHPCPICDIHKNHLRRSLNHRADLRTWITPIGQYSVAHPPLLFIPSHNVVPLPFHVFLGLGKRVINILNEVFGEEAVTQAVKQVKTTHSMGSGGRSAVNDLTGPELSQWVKKGLTWNLIKNDAQTGMVGQLAQWMDGLYEYLLRKRKWTNDDWNGFKQLVDEIQSEWQILTDEPPFPKLHMLTHCAEFAKYHGYLGKYCETHIESYHAKHNFLMRHTHRNRGSDVAEKLRRSLADSALTLVQPALKSQHSNIMEC